MLVLVIVCVWALVALCRWFILASCPQSTSSLSLSLLQCSTIAAFGQLCWCPTLSLCALLGFLLSSTLCRYSGSDLKELAKAAANAPVRDFLRAESKQAMPTPRSMEEVPAHCYHTVADTHNDATRSSSTTRDSEATSCPNG